MRHLEKKFPACYFQLLEHPDLTNIPIGVETYCKEAEAGLKNEDIAAITCPQAISTLQKEFLYWYNRMYLMPNRQLIQLVKERVIPHRLSVWK